MKDNFDSVRGRAIAEFIVQLQYVHIYVLSTQKRTCGNGRKSDSNGSLSTLLLVLNSPCFFCLIYTRSSSTVGMFISVNIP